ncbi:SD08430p [Taphrina deformans PYCC 5710]|uniref:SD08430p n=1 Tax=Taphrina deformans (strain PYCC 5710 / ATCC 11124 / CBS 356.35 / IMI 108563 / JCM 9778 / NBRC 8474) TaxID=1097556 RepID=S0BE50_TAPDE|nr:SD08430p [Taphrina deformans PYCC 5710]|eukprot:CCG81312.1 SD08430p [Taphrina deformans PYCC 5710]
MSSRRNKAKSNLDRISRSTSPEDEPFLDSDMSLRQIGTGPIASMEGPFDEIEKPRTSRGLTTKDKHALALLIVLYCLQGVPLGLTMGSLPYLLQPKLTYASIGVFSLASYPYSLKLLWSPIVDAIYNTKLGRRKSWILPVQATVGVSLLYIANNVDHWVDTASTNLYTLTTFFFLLVLLCATQDIAVDGWALTLLSEENLSYASTAQTVGLNTGYFLSFTVFLAFQSPEFANTYFRSAAQQSDVGFVTLSGYMAACGWATLAVTVFLLFIKKEAKETSVTDSVMAVYDSIWAVSKLPQVRVFMLIHLIAKIGFVTNDSVTNLKLLEKGLKKEDLSLAVLIDFPLEILFGYYAAKWSTGPTPLRPWLLSFQGRLVAAGLGMLLVYFMPSEVGWFYFVLIVLEHIISSFMSTVQFVSASAFHTQIADPLIGGTYMTLLNTISNLGGTWPKYFVLEGVDKFTIKQCLGITEKTSSTAFNIYDSLDMERCKSLGGTVNITRDGYYIMNFVCIIVGSISFWTFIQPRVLVLQAKSPRSWRVTR